MDSEQRSRELRGESGHRTCGGGLGCQGRRVVQKTHQRFDQGTGTDSATILEDSLGSVMKG